MSTNEQLVYTAALRYALGRRSYIVSSIIEELNRKWDKFPETTRSSMVRDIAEYLQDITENEMFDAEYWYGFGQAKYVSLSEESKQWVLNSLKYQGKLFPFHG